MWPQLEECNALGLFFFNPLSCRMFAGLPLEHSLDKYHRNFRRCFNLFPNSLLAGTRIKLVKTPPTPPALCMWLEHRPQCSTSSKRQMGVSHSVAVMERNYPAEYCPPTHTTSNSLDAQYSPKHNIFFSAHGCLVYERSQFRAQKWPTKRWGIGDILCDETFLVKCYLDFRKVHGCVRHVHQSIFVLKASFLSAM